MNQIFLQTQSEWVKKTITEMTLEEKVGQLLVSRASKSDIEEIIEKGMVGGLYFGSDVPPERIAHLKKMSKIPLFAAQDLEVGYTAGSNEWPSAMALGAIGDPELAYKWSYYQGLEARANGINCVFGPVLDIALNPESQATSTRPISGDPVQTADLGIQVVKGYQDAGILPFAKHFPGFGRGNQDAHMELSKCNADKETLYKEDLLTFQKAIEKANLAGIMTGHVQVNCIDPNVPMPMSKKLMDILPELGFNGLTITDSLAMKGILALYSSSELYPGVIESGHDMVLANYHTPDKEGFRYLLEAFQSGRISMEILDYKVGRILQMKEYLEAQKMPLINLDEHKKLFREISDKSMTAVRLDGKEFIPLDKSKKSLIVVVSQEFVDVKGELPTATTPVEKMVNMLKEKFPCSEIELLPIFSDGTQNERLLNKSLEYKEIHIIANAMKRAYSGAAHYHRPLLSLVRALQPKINTFVIFGNPAAAKDLPQLPQLLFCYGGSIWVESMLNVLEGKMRPQGKLPIKY